MIIQFTYRDHGPDSEAQEGPEVAGAKGGGEEEGAPPAIEKREKTWDEMTAEEKFNSQLPSFLPGHGKTASELPTECVKDDDHHWRQRKADAVRHAITKTNNFLEVNGNAQDGSSGGGGGCRPIVKRAIKASSPRATSCTTSAD